MSYNHPVWPSPRAKVAAKKLHLDDFYDEDGILTKMKRLTHAQALELLRRRARKATVEEFLAMPKEEAWLALGCYYVGLPLRTYDPVYGPRW